MYKIKYYKISENFEVIMKPFSVIIRFPPLALSTKFGMVHIAQII